MVQAFGADAGDGVPESQNESAHASLIGEVMDFVKDNKTASAIAAIGAAAGSVYLARAPIGRFLGKFGGSLFAAEEAVGVAAKLGKAPVGRQLAVAGDELIVSTANVEKVVATGMKSEAAISTAVKGEESIVSGVKAEEAIVSGAKATEGSRRPLLDALDDAAKAGKTKAPEPWVYHPENRVILKDLPKGGASEIKSAGEGIESAGTIGSTHSPDPADLAILASKHRFLLGQ
ncbi:MAG: hypothetical protein IT342_02120 [Candidatus Melainabacteria bacterium]|nr:hypothetical protein [Candidatus Melainabacteria bacterium]